MGSNADLNDPPVVTDAGLNPPELPADIVDENADSSSDHESQSEQEYATGDDQPPALVEKKPASNVPSSVTRIVPNVNAASLWCSKRGRNHTSLLGWGIANCPSCGQNLCPPRKVGVERRDRITRGRGMGNNANGQASTSSTNSRVTSSSSRSSSPRDYHHPNALAPGQLPPRPPPYGPVPGRRPIHPMIPYGPRTAPNPFGTDPNHVWQKDLDVRYQVKFLYDMGYEIGNRPWDGLLDLENERKAILDNSLSIIEIVTVVQTNIKRNIHRDTDTQSRQIMREGILRNPRYTVEVRTNDLIIHSRRIIDVLKQIITYYPDVRLTGDSVTLKEPYCFVFHHMQEITAYPEDPAATKAGETSVETRCDEETRRHLNILRDAVEAQYKIPVEKELIRHRKPNPTATFKLLWLLFKPGMTVYTQMDGSLQACVVKSVVFNNYTVSKLSTSYTLELWYMNYDGRRLGRCECDRIIAPYEGERQITSLNVFPCEYLDSEDGGLMRRKLEERGEKFYRYLSGAQVLYSGESLGTERRWYDGRAIIDIASYYNYGRAERSLEFGSRIQQPEVGDVQDSSNVDEGESDDDSALLRPRPPPPPPPVGYYRQPPYQFRPQYKSSNNADQKDRTKVYNVKFPWREYDDIDPKKTESLELVDPVTGAKNRHRYLLCPKVVIGFVLKSRVWEELDIECCSKPIVNRAAVDTLVMPEERKTMIKALVYRYTDPNTTNGRIAAPWSADFIENKGDGQIFLLHGSPGVGKTYTAECIAESTGRPLLSLTCGDIGNDEVVLEKRLSKWFRLAEIWGAVMLLDEADVFLERRATSDLQRNSLVSVFLRTMEYYRGILFLTTNRVGHFDDAFISRIHVVIRYDGFSDSDRERIWTQFFNKLKRERGKNIEIPNRVKNYVLKDPEMTQIPWNGREIRNAFQTAVALAEFRFANLEDKEPDAKACLEREDFEKVCEMTGAFKGYLKSVSGLDESQRARSDLARNDAFTER